ncbi:MAG TPA: YdcH family protein [Polyangia bacterium]|jgi:uncharacterized protein YdcH (DUF465 family)
MERSREGIDVATGATDPTAEILRLRARHTEIEKRLHELERHLSLTADEQVERARLKKEKLWSKDRIAVLAQLASAA